MPKTRTQKEEAVKVLAEKFSKSKSIVFTDYQGLTMKHLSDLRGKLSDQKAELTVAKNTLIELALKKSEMPTPSEEAISGPTAVMFSYEDEVSPIKILVKALKDASIGKVKSGFLGSDLLDSVSINKLATLPSKQELQAKLVGSISSPLYGIVGVLQANLRNLVYVFDQIRVKRGGE